MPELLNKIIEKHNRILEYYSIENITDGLTEREKYFLENNMEFLQELINDLENDS